MHGCLDVAALGGVEVHGLSIGVHWLNIGVANSAKGGTRGRGVFIPNLLGHHLLLLLLLFSFLSLSSDKNLFVIWWFEGRSLFADNFLEEFVLIFPFSRDHN